MRLKLAAPDNVSASVQHGVTSAILGGARVIASGPTIPVTEEMFVSVNFKALVPIGIKRDYLSPCDIQILHKVNYCVSVGRSHILQEWGALMHHVGNIRSSAILQENEITHN